MSTGNDHNQFTPADIEKYHRGQLSTSQRHAMEKAALDDPFLADALEGYAFAEDVPADIHDLDNRLQQRLGNAKLIPVLPRGSRKTAWLRIAAMFILLAGGAILASQFLFNKKGNDLATMDKKNTENTIPDTQKTATVIPGIPGNSDSTSAASSPTGAKEVTGTLSPGNVGNTQDQSPVKTVTPTPVITKEFLADQKQEPGKQVAREEDDKQGAVAEELSRKNASTERQNKQKNPDVPQSRATEKYADKMQLNTFRGRVIDNNNRGLPFANVTNTRDNVGTYTDASGNFVLTSPDTVLEVQVRSLGYDNNSLRLRNSDPNNTVVLENDRGVVAETIISRSNSNAMRRQTENLKIEEPEPADGWENYDVYLANNLNIPGDYTPKPSTQREVELSFEVNKQGEPVNIRVERSLCKSCDDEAIRLVKEGPKWKRKAKKRTRITVTF